MVMNEVVHIRYPEGRKYNFVVLAIVVKLGRINIAMDCHLINRNIGIGETIHP